MAKINPYAPMKASLKVGEPVAASGGVWRDDDQVIVTHGASFPRRCVKCNAPVDEPGKVRKLYWHHPAIYLLIVLWIVIYLVVAMATRKSMEIDPSLCDEHRSARRKWIAIGWLGSLGGLFAVPMLGAAAGVDVGPAILLGTLCFIGFAILGVTRSRILYPRRIDDRYACLKGADESFLASLPNWV